MNLGLRYDYSAPWTEVNGKLSNLAPNGELLVVGDPGLDRFYRPDRNNFAPRVGLAYDVSGSGSTIIRAGFSLLYETLLQANSVQQVENNPPYSASAVTRNPTPFDAVQPWRFSAAWAKAGSLRWRMSGPAASTYPCS